MPLRNSEWFGDRILPANGLEQANTTGFMKQGGLGMRAVTDPVRPIVRSKFFFQEDRKFAFKGVTYGPFRPDDPEQPIYFRDKTQTRQDFALMQAAGINVLRTYHPPPRWLLDLAVEHELRLMITIPWAQHLPFLRVPEIRRSVVTAVRRMVTENAGHPAVLGYFVGNEVPTTMIRWLGFPRVREFIEHLIEVGRKADPGALFSYASFPPTEYLLPQNVDFHSFNVYLHRQADFERYLLRLQNLAEDKPLIISEFGMDTLRHPETEQAELLKWHVESVIRCGLAGSIVFAWTDEWFTGGADIDDWAFGIVRRDRSPKPAYETLKKLWRGEGSMTDRVPLPSYPKVSVIVCSYNGGRTLEACLQSLKEIDYPDYEVVLVDDGSKDDTQQIAARHTWVRHVHQSNMGLSYARNVGARAATGDILAYTDSDCMADPDWLYYLVNTLLSGEYAGVGGPNISPPAEDWIQACVSASPGGPSHVLLTDVVAEHIPGCNMAFHRWAFEMVGGFDVEYRKAGDDVDFCWRLQGLGHVIAFSPAAIVWHYRRFTLGAFRKQQEGYGEAESMLRFKHLVFFGPTGTVRWKGMIYGAPRFTWVVNRPVIYHGVFGQGFFQAIYPAPQSEVAAYLSSIEWLALTLFLFCLSIPLPGLRIIPYLMFGGTLLVALSYMVRARLEPRYDTIPARLLVIGLALTQPWFRGWSRYFTWLKAKRTPKRVIASKERLLPVGVRGGVGERIYWNEAGAGREVLIGKLCHQIEVEGWKYSTDTGWTDWDVQIYGNFWWVVRVRTVTEYHGGPKCLTRAKLMLHPVMTTQILLLSFLGLFTAILLSLPLPALAWQVLWAGALAGMGWRGYRLKRRVAQLVDAAAGLGGLQPIRERRAD